MRFLIAFILSAGLLVPATVTAQEDGARETDGRQCLSLNRIDRTEIVDDQTILFYMRGGDIYVNRLPHRCHRLEFRDAFMYRTSLNQLCNVDIITVLDDLGFGFSSGISCGLGMFHPTTEEDANAMLGKE